MKRDREFFRNRVRWRVVTVLVVLAAVSYAAGVAERVRAQGAWGAVPTWALMIAARGSEAQQYFVQRWGSSIRPSRWMIELDRRMTTRAVSKWEAWISLPPFETPEGGLYLALRVPHRWRQGIPITPKFDGWWAQSRGFWLTLRERPRAAVSTTTEVMIEYDVTREWCGNRFLVGVARQPCTMVPEGEPLLEPVRSEAWDARVRTLLEPRLILDGGHATLVVNDRVESWSDVRIAMAFEVEVVSKGKAIGRGKGSVSWAGPTYRVVREIEMEWIGMTADGAAELAKQGKSEVLVRGVAPPDTWQSTYFGTPDAVDCARWAGEFRVPLRVDLNGSLWDKPSWLRPIDKAEIDKPGVGGR